MRYRSEMNRRQFVGAVVAVGAVAWSVPSIVTVDPAGAATRHSAPPAPRSRVTEGAAEMGPPLPAGLPGSLPFTGDNQRDELAVGAALLAAGAGLLALNREGVRGE